jgi:hypothetical protein
MGVYQLLLKTLLNGQVCFFKHCFFNQSCKYVLDAMTIVFKARTTEQVPNQKYPRTLAKFVAFVDSNTL